MKVELWALGKDNKSYLDQGINLYIERIRHFCPFELKILSIGKKKGKTAPKTFIKQEAERINRQLTAEHILFSLDERGKPITSTGLSRLIEQRQLMSDKTIVFLIGGAYGIDVDILNKSQQVLSLSALTFPHQLVRLIMTEQIYRAFSILHHQPYHHL